MGKVEASLRDTCFRLARLHFVVKTGALLTSNFCGCYYDDNGDGQKLIEQLDTTRHGKPTTTLHDFNVKYPFREHGARHPVFGSVARASPSESI